ncbi:DUF2339 domain-containing protein [Mucilaginibacter phyllosphaerae]
MELVYLSLFVIIIYLLISNKNFYNEKINSLEARLVDLQRLVKQNTLTKPTNQVTQVPTVTTKVEPPVPEPVVPPMSPVIVEKQKDVIADPLETIRRPVKHADAPKPPRPVYQRPEPKPELSFFERYPDLEKFIGENLINKIGIAILVLAIGFFVKYAIDNNWVGPVGRVGIGVLCGGILIAIAHRMRNSYRAFSSVLVGGGLAVLYFTISLAYHQFHLFDQTVSFIILIVITCFAVVLSLLYDKQELAVIALVGGLASPFMVSTGQANYHALFNYLVILNTGLLVIAYNKSWRILNATAFGLTAIVFAAVLTSLSAPTYATGFLYASILYLMFFGINVANNVKENKKFVAADFTILISNTALYFAAGIYLLTVMHHEDLRGLFSAGLAIINLVLSYLMFRNRKVDTNILYLLIGITLTFISLTAPLQLNGNYITLFWAAESVLLYWLYLKSQIQLMKLTALIVWGAMIVSLAMDWGQVYLVTNTIFIIANKGFITTMVAAVGSYLLYSLIKKDDDPKVYGFAIPADLYKVSALLLLFLSGFLEINHQFLNHYPDTHINLLYLMLYVTAFVCVFDMLSKKMESIRLDWKQSAIIIAVTIVAYLICLITLFDLQYIILTQHRFSPLHFWANWFAAVFAGLLFYQLSKIASEHFDEAQQNLATWVLSAVIVLFLSLELSLASNIVFFSPVTSVERIETVFVKVGLPILWGLLSFALMFLGMRYKLRTMRIASLTLFSVTLLKLFLFDIQGIPPAGKIAAFFCLGVLLLIVSFMYQKVKKILVEDESKDK